MTLTTNTVRAQLYSITTGLQWETSKTLCFNRSVLQWPEPMVYITYLKQGREIIVS